MIRSLDPPSLRERTAAAAEALIGAARSLLDGVAEAVPFLETWPTVGGGTRAAAPYTLPVLSWLETARRLSVPSTAPLVEALATEAEALPWRQSYTAADFGAAFLDRYGWTELIGTWGPVPSETITCGILMLGPDIHYPSHAHEAEELYVPLAGEAIWTRGDEAPATRPAGPPIHHPSWLPHAMRTRAEPLVALYVWRGGDLAAKPRILERA